MLRHLLDDTDLGSDGLAHVLERASQLKRLRGHADHPRPLAGKSIGMIMEKASTRTRISFEVGIYELGGQPVALAGRDLQLGRDEPLEDTARVLSRYLHGVVMRTHAHERITTLAAASQVPVINALTDKFHPCQLLADLMTVREHRKQGLAGMRVAWIGDGNNMAHSWILASALADFELHLACPVGYQPAADVLAQADAMKRGQRVVTTDLDGAVRGAHVVTTDVWASMGQEEEREVRKRAFSGYCVSDARMKLAAPGALFLHCLPAHRGEEVDASVIDGPQSVVWDEAENRLHAQKALLEALLTA
ncbi:MAG TPA: ornithine carbamoyltransferase [Polyangiales bacterium]|nr:ornithine carbamoyltransferase [Polyangiales bacterium]